MSVARVGSRSAWFGPASVVGAMVGVVLWGLPYAFTRGGGLLWLWLVPPVAGLALLVWRGTARQTGVGLLVSCLTLPVALFAFAVVGFTVGSG